MKCFANETDGSRGLSSHWLAKANFSARPVEIVILERFSPHVHSLDSLRHSPFRCSCPCQPAADRDRRALSRRDDARRDPPGRRCRIGIACPGDRGSRRLTIQKRQAERQVTNQRFPKPLAAGAVAAEKNRSVKPVAASVLATVTSTVSRAQCGSPACNGRASQC